MLKQESDTITWFIIENHTGSGIIQLLREVEGIRVITKSELSSEKDFKFGHTDKICITTETVLDDVLRRLDDDTRHLMIEKLKNKVAFREILKPIYPDFFYKPVTLYELQNVSLDPEKKYFVKPVKGYWGSGGRAIHDGIDLVSITDEIRAELKYREQIFSNAVLSQENMIIEEFLEGEEYAVDMFYDDQGAPVITNICHHPLPKHREYLHVLYYTSHAFYDGLYQRFINFFTQLNRELQARSLTIHGEFKDHSNQLIPVELNPLRFGSDGFADLPYHAFGFNPFLAFAENRKPDWKTLWKAKQDHYFGYCLGYNGTNVDLQHYRPDLRKFRNLFTKILTDNAMNYQQQLAFSAVYVEETSLEKIFDLLNVDFEEFFVHVKQYSKTSFHELYQAGIKVHIDADQLVWRKDEPGDYLLLLLDGEMQVFIENNNNHEIILDTIHAGNIVGEFSSLDGLPRSASVRTRSDCVAMKISGPAFRKLLNKVPDILEDLFWQQMNRVRRMNKLIAN